MGQRLACLVLLGLSLALALGCAPAGAAPVVDGEFELKSQLEANNKIVAGPDGDLWVTLSDAAEDVARVQSGGQVTEYNLPEVTRPNGIAVGPEGRLWITQEHGVASFSPQLPEVGSHATTIADVNSTASIVAGPDGQMWVASSEHLIHFQPSNPAGAVSVSVPNLAPHDIDVAGSRLAIADTEQPRIATFAVAGGAPVDEVDIPIGGGSQGLAGNAAGQIAYSDPNATLSEPSEQIGLINFPSPPLKTNVTGDPFGVALGADGAFWIAQSAAPTGVTRLTTDNQSTHLGGFSDKVKPRQITAGPNNTMWVTLEDPGFPGVDKVGRISGLEPPPGPAATPPVGAVPISAPKGVVPQTRLAKGPRRVVTKRRRARVRFMFSSPQRSARFQCALTPLRKGKRPKPPRFKACASPKVFKLRPGRYRFQVRAVFAGAVDPTPASTTVTVVRRR